MYQKSRSSKESPQEIASDSGYRITGKVFSQDEDAVPHSTVVFTAPDSTVFSILADKQGRYSVNLPNGNYKAEAYQHGFDVHQSSIVVQDARLEKNFRLSSQLVTIRGRTFSNTHFDCSVSNSCNLQEGDFIPNVKVVLRKHLFERTVFSNQFGEYELKGVPPGEYTIYAYRQPSFQNFQKAVSIKKSKSRGGNTILHLPLQRYLMGNVTGIIRAKGAGNSIRYGKVTGYILEKADYVPDNFPVAEPTSYLQNSGRFQIDNLTAGRYRLTIESPLIESLNKEIWIDGNQNKIVYFDYKAKHCKVKGFVFSHAKQTGVSRAKLFFNGVLQGETNHNGHFQYNLPCRQYHLKVMHPEYRIHTDSVVIKTHLKNYKIALKKETTTIQFSVVDRQKKPIPKIKIQPSPSPSPLQSFNMESMALTTNQMGTTDAVSIPIGEHLYFETSHPQNRYEKKTIFIDTTDAGLFSTDGFQVYTIPLEEVFIVKGTVFGNTDKPLSSVKVFIDGGDSYTFTNTKGEFALQIPNRDGVKLQFFKDSYFIEKRDIFYHTHNGTLMTINMRLELDYTTSLTSVRIFNTIREIKNEILALERYLIQEFEKLFLLLDSIEYKSAEYEGTVLSHQKAILDAITKFQEYDTTKYISRQAVQYSFEIQSKWNALRNTIPIYKEDIRKKIDSFFYQANPFFQIVQLKKDYLKRQLRNLQSSIANSPFLEDADRSKIQTTTNTLKDQYQTRIENYYANSQTKDTP